MERTKRKLRTRLTDGLCGNHTHSLTQLYHTCGSKVAAIALGTNTVLAFASEHRADLNHLDGAILNSLCLGLGNLLTGSDDKLA